MAANQASSPQFQTNQSMESRKIASIIIGAVAALSFSAHAFTSIAAVSGSVSSTVSWAANYDSQEAADAAAITICVAHVKKLKKGPKPSACKVMFQAEVGGYGALTCGLDDCGVSTGHLDEQAAVDASYAQCTKVTKECQEKGISAWNDGKGLPMPEPKRPPQRQRTCADGDLSLAERVACANSNSKFR